MPSIRAIALAVPRRGDDLLVFEYFDPGRRQTFYRPLGGGIEFGETAEAAVRRELREELGVGLLGVRRIGVLENIFHGMGRDGHELAFIFDCRLDDPAVYERDLVGEILDDAGTKVMWRPLGDFGAERPLYPNGLADLLGGVTSGGVLTLSRAVLSDDELDGLEAVCRSQPAYWRISGDQDPDTMTRDEVVAMLREDATAEGCETVVARDPGGRVVGFAQLLLRHPRDGHPWIGLLLVDGRQGRRGHGRAIVAAVEERFRAAGATAVRLGVLVANEPARPFWEALGYRQIDVRPDVAKGRPTAVMEKRLS